MVTYDLYDKYLIGPGYRIIDESFEYEYDYYCDFLPKERREFAFGEYSAKVLYSYLRPHDCLVEDDSGLTVYPNPTTGYCIFESDFLESGDGTVILMDRIGQELHSFPVEHRGGVLELDLSAHPEGIYIIGLRTSDGSFRQSDKVVKVQ